VVTRSTDQASPGHQQPVTDHVVGRLLAGNLGFAILLDVDLVAIGCREHLCALVSSGCCVRGVDAA